MSLQIVSLRSLLEQMDEEDIFKDILFLFESKECKGTHSSKDIEAFLHNRNKAIDFEKQGISRTYLVFYNEVDFSYLAGYFSIANKNLQISENNFNRLNRTKQRLFQEFGYESDKKNFISPAILLGQFGKNYNVPEGLKGHQVVNGDDLMASSIEIIKEAYKLIGGKVLYLECEDHKKLTEFYERHGFAKLEIPKQEDELLIYMKKLSKI